MKERTYGKRCLFFNLFFLSVLFFLWNPPEKVKAAPKLSVHYIDVGQGNATLIRYKKKNYLYDCGKESEYEKLRLYLNSRNITKIHLLFLSHNDSDHMGSAARVIRDFSVKKVVRAGYQEVKENSTIAELEKNLKKYHVKTLKKIAGDQIPTPKGLKITVLSPNQNYEESNENSLVLRVQRKKRVFLLTGDVDAKIENILLERYSKKQLAAHVLLVAHHGSDTASGVMFLHTVRAKYAVISVGENNSYGHPKATVLKRLGYFTKNIFRTDEKGTIVFTTNGTKLTYQFVKGTLTFQGTYIGNVNSRVYHSKRCTMLPDEKNRMYFKTVKEAEKAGYRPHASCCSK